MKKDRPIERRLAKIRDINAQTVGALAEFRVNTLGILTERTRDAGIRAKKAADEAVMLWWMDAKPIPLRGKYR